MSFFIRFCSISHKILFVQTVIYLSFYLLLLKATLYCRLSIYPRVSIYYRASEDKKSRLFLIAASTVFTRSLCDLSIDLSLITEDYTISGTIDLSASIYLSLAVIELLETKSLDIFSSPRVSFSQDPSCENCDLPIDLSLIAEDYTISETIYLLASPRVSIYFGMYYLSVSEYCHQVLMPCFSHSCVLIAIALFSFYFYIIMNESIYRLH